MFVANGIYRFSRNPMYLSLAGWLVAWAVYLQSAVSFLGVFLFIYFITQWQIKPEEYWLEKKFGESYLEYKKKSDVGLTNKKSPLIKAIFYILRNDYLAAQQSATFRKTICNEIPVYNIPEFFDVVWTTVSEFQVVSVFPNV